MRFVHQRLGRSDGACEPVQCSGVQQFCPSRGVFRQACKAGGMPSKEPAFSQGRAVRQTQFPRERSGLSVAILHHPLQEGHAQGLGTKVFTSTQVAFEVAHEFGREAIVCDGVAPAQVGDVLRGEGIGRREVGEEFCGLVAVAHREPRR